LPLKSFSSLLPLLKTNLLKPLKRRVVIGTIGLIKMANKNGHIDKPVAYFEKLKKTGFRISDDLYQHAIRLASK